MLAQRAAQTVTINTPTSPLATIYYTTDGTFPTTSSTEYSGPITVSATQMVKAIAMVTGYSVPSGVGSAAYTIGSADTVGNLVKAKPAATSAVGQAPTLVNHVASGSGVTSAVNMTGANFIAICESLQYGSPSVPTDSSGNTYTLAAQELNGAYPTVYLYAAYSPTVTSSMTFANTGENGPWPIAAMGFSGVASGPDQSNGGTTGKPTLSAGSITPTNANELIVSCYSMSNSGVLSPTPSATVSPLTLVDTADWTVYPGYAFVGSAYQVQTTATAAGATWTNNAVNGNAGLIASFYSAETPTTLVATTTGVPEGFVGTAYSSTGSTYSNQLTATGGVQPYSWSCLSTCALPRGLSLSSGGLITGTPTSAGGPTNVSFKVTDSHTPTAATATVTLPMTIASTAFSFTAGTCRGSVLNGTQYVAFGGCTLSGSGGAAPLVYSYNTTLGGSYASIPPGLILNSSTGALTGTNYGQGEYDVQFIATDNLGTQATVVVTFELAGNNTLGGCSLFPSDSAFHINVSSLPVDTSSVAPIYSAYQSATIRPLFGAASDSGQPNGIPFLVVPYNQALVGVTTEQYQSYFTEGPWPWYAPIEGSQNGSQASGSAYVGDGHSLIVQTAGGGNPCELWEMYTSQFNGTPYTSGPWLDGSNAYWSNIGSTGTGAYAMLPQANGSTDAAGLPVAPLVVNYDEVAAGAVLHSIRFTLNHTLNYHVWPATAQAGEGSCTGGYEDDNNLILQPGSPGGSVPTSCGATPLNPMGEIYRLKSSVSTPSCASTSPQSAVIIQAFRNYGIILADNGMSGGLVGTPDSRWSDFDLTCLRNLTLADFEPVNVQSVIKTLDSSNLPTVSYQTISSTTAPVAASTPSFSPGAGTYSSAQTVTIGSSTPSAAIYYTTNGTTPTTGSQVYSGPITVSSTETLQAIAVASGYSTSAAGSATYTINLTQAATPTFSPGAGTSSSAQTVTIGTATPSATIYYTTNGTTPTTGSQVYSGPITVSSTETLQAIAVASGYSTSAAGSAAYTINLTQAATPTFTVAVSPASLTVTAGQSGSTTILVVPQNAFGGAVSFSCSGLPSGASCSFSPATVTTSGTVASTTLTVTTATTTAVLHRNSSPLFPGSALAVALCWFGWKKRRGLQMMLLVLVALGLSLCTGCSLGVWSNPQATTQATASTVTVIATSGSQQPTTSFTLTVQ